MISCTSLKAFICPLCMKTFNSPGELQSHFDQQHESQIEDDATSVVSHCRGCKIHSMLLQVPCM